MKKKRKKKGIASITKIIVEHKKRLKKELGKAKSDLEYVKYLRKEIKRIFPKEIKKKEKAIKKKGRYKKK